MHHLLRFEWVLAYQENPAIALTAMASGIASAVLIFAEAITGKSLLTQASRQLAGSGLLLFFITLAIVNWVCKIAEIYSTSHV